MRLGFFMMPLHPPEKPRTECFDEDVEWVIHADRLGFTEGWVGPHLSNVWEPIPAHDLFISHLFAEQKAFDSMVM